MISNTTARRAILAGFCVAAGALTACGGGASASYTDGGKPRTKIEHAAHDCSVVLGHLAGFLADNVGDNGATISFDTRGDEDARGDELDTVACVLARLDASEFVVSQMDNTRALDGQQRAEWDGFEAVWSYHPNSGMSLAIHET